MKVLWIAIALLLAAVIGFHVEPKKIVIGGEKVASIAWTVEEKEARAPISGAATSTSGTMFLTSNVLIPATGSTPEICANTIGMPITCATRGR